MTLNDTNCLMISQQLLRAAWYEDLTDLTLEEEGYSIQVDGVEAEVRSRLKSENFKGEL